MAVKTQRVRISTYVRNVGRSFGYAVGDVAGEYMPTMKSITDDTKSALSDAKMSMGDIKSSIKDMIKDYKTGLVDNTIDDLKTGNWYNKKREEDALNNMFGDFDFDDDWGDFDDEDSDFSDSSDDTRDTRAIINSIDSVGENISKNVAYSNARSAEYIVANQKASTRAMYELTGKGFNQVSNILLNMSGTMAGLASIGGPLTQHINNSSVFYTNTTESLNKITESLDKLVERTAYMDNMNKKSGSRGKKTISDIAANGEFSLSSYIDMVKENTKDQVEMVKGFKDMIDMMGGSGGKNMSLAKLIPQAVLKKVMPNFFKASMQQFSESINDALTNGLVRLSKAGKASGNPIVNMLADIFGVDLTVKKSINTSKYERGPMQWDGEAKMALTRVIPDYLAKIYGAISGNEQYFDYKTGKYNSLQKIQNKQKEYIDRQIKNTGRDFKDLALRNTRSKNRALVEEEIDLLIEKAIFDSDFSFEQLRGLASSNRKIAKAIQEKFGLSNETMKALTGAAKEASRQGLTKNRNAMGRFEREVYGAQSEINRYFNEAEANGLGLERLLSNAGFFNDNIVILGGGGRGRKGATPTRRAVLEDYENKYNTKKSYKAVKTTNSKGKSVYNIGGYNFSEKDAKEIEKELDKLDSDDDKEAWLKNNAAGKEMKSFASNAMDTILRRNDEVGNDNVPKTPMQRAIGAIKHFWQKPFYAVTLAMDNLSRGINNLFWGENKDGGIFGKLKSFWEGFKEKYFPQEGESLWDAIKRDAGQVRSSISGKVFGDKYNSLKEARRQFNARYLSEEKERDRFGREAAQGSGLIKYAGGDSNLVGKARNGLNIIKKGSKYFIKGKDDKLHELDPEQRRTQTLIDSAYANEIKDTVKNSKSVKFIGDGAKTLGGGIMQFIKQTLFGEADPEEQKEKIFDNLGKAMGEVIPNKGRIGLGAIVGGVGVPLITGALVGPIAGAAIGAGVGLATKSQAFQNFLFGEGDPESKEYQEGLLGGFGKALKADGFKGAKSTGIGAAVGGVSGLMMGSPVVGAILGSAAGYVASSDKAKNFLFGEGDEKTWLGNIKDEVKKRLPNISAGMLAGLIAGPFGIPGNLLLGAGIGYVSTSQKFHNFMFGDPDDPKSKGLAGAIHDRIINPLDNIMHNLANNIKGRLTNLFKSLYGVGKNILSKGLNVGKKVLGNTAVGRVLGSAKNKAVGFAKGVAEIPGMALAGTARAIQKSNLNNGFGIYDTNLGRNMTAEERANYRSILQNGSVIEENGKYYEVDPMTGRIKKEIDKDVFDKKRKDAQSRGYKLDSAYGNLDLAMSKMDNDTLKSINLKDSASVQQAIYNSLISDNMSMDEKRAALGKYDKIIGKFKSGDGYDFSAMSTLLKDEIKGREKKEKNEEDNHKSILDIDDAITGPQGIIAKLGWLLEDTKFIVEHFGGKIKRTAGKVGNAIVEAAGPASNTSDGSIEAMLHEEGGRSGLRRLLAGGGSEDKQTRTEFDAFGNPHQYTHNNQGEWVENTSDKETVKSRKIMDKFSNSLESLPIIGGVLGGLKGLKNLFGSSGEGKEKKKGLLDSLADFLDPDSENSGWAKMANFLSSGKSWLTATGGNIMGFTGLASMGLALGGLSGKLNGVTNAVLKSIDKDDNATSHGRMNSGSKTATLADGSTVELQVDSTTGKAVTDENGNYLDNNGNTVSPNDVNSISSTQNRSLSKGLWKNMAIKTAKNLAKGNKAVGGLAAGMIKGGSKLVSKAAKISGTKFNKIAKVGTAAKKAGSKLLKNGKAAGKAATSSKLVQKLGEFMAKIGDVLGKVLKKFKINVDTSKIDDLVSGLTKAFSTKIDDMGAKAAKGFTDAIPVIGQAIWVADMVVTGTNAWGDAENILGIIEEATTGEKIIATLIALINEGIPVIGGIIPHDIMASLIIGIFEKIGWFKEDIANLREKQARAKETVDQYNSENGTTYTVEEYNLNVNDEVKSGWWTSTKHKVSSWFDTKKNNKVKAKAAEAAGQGSGLIKKVPTHRLSSGFKHGKKFKTTMFSGGASSLPQDASANGIFGAVANNFNSDNMLSGMGLNKEDMSSFSEQIKALSKAASEGDLKTIASKGLKMSATMMKSPLAGFFKMGYNMAKSFNSMGGIFGNLIKPVSEVTEDATVESVKMVDKVKNIAKDTWDKLKDAAKSFWSGLFGQDDSSTATTTSDTAGGASGFVSQFDPKYQNYQVSGTNFAGKGCGPAVASMTASALGKSLSVGSAVSASKNYQVGNGVTLDYFQRALGSQGIDTEYIAGGGAGDLYNSIASGKKVILLGQDASNTSKANSPFGPNNHYVVATGLDRSGNVVVNDPELNGPATYGPGILNSVKYGVAAGRSGIGRMKLPKLFRSLAGGGNPRNDETTQTIWAYLTNTLSMSEAAAAGVMGNMEAESGCNPDVKQKGGSAYGLCQWDGARRDNLKKQSNYQTLGVQLAYLASELPSQPWKKSGTVTDYKSSNIYSYSSMTYSEFKALTDVAKATIKFEAAFERAGKPNIEDRVKWAKAYYEMFSGKTYEVPSSVAASTLSESVETDTTSDESTDESTTSYKPTSIFDTVSTVSSIFGDALSGVFNGNSESTEDTSSTSESSDTTTSDSTSTNASTTKSSHLDGHLNDKIIEINGGKAQPWPTGQRTAASVVDIARSQLGVTEAGDNITDYGEFTGTNGKAWCAAFASWVFDKAFNGDASKVFRGSKTAAVSTILDRYKKANAVYDTPQEGDLVIYKNGTSHVGIVEAVDGKKVYTIEGNTSADKSFSRDGGSVYRKNFDYTNKSTGKGAKLTGFGRPDWSAAGSGLMNYSDLARVSGGSSGVLINSRAGSRSGMPSVVDRRTGRIVPFSRFAGGATNITDASRNMLNELSTNVSNNNKNSGISPELIAQLLSAITNILNNIADNTAPVNKIYQALVSYLEAGGSSGTDTVKINKTPKKAAVGQSGNNEIDANIKSLVATLADLAKG